MNPVGPHKITESTLSETGDTKLLSDLRKLWESIEIKKDIESKGLSDLLSKAI